MNNKIVARGAALALAIGSTTAAYASMGNIGTTYGVLPSDVASAQALSMFNTQVSAVYYNPAYLTKDPRGELTMGLLHADHELRAFTGKPKVKGRQASGSGGAVGRSRQMESDPFERLHSHAEAQKKFKQEKAARQYASERAVGTAAENVLEALEACDAGAATAIDALRKATREASRRKAMERRERMLAEMGLTRLSPMGSSGNALTAIHTFD